jgi:hypothetical protein
VPAAARVARLVFGQGGQGGAVCAQPPGTRPPTPRPIARPVSGACSAHRVHLRLAPPVHNSVAGVTRARCTSARLPLTQHVPLTPRTQHVPLTEGACLSHMAFHELCVCLRVRVRVRVVHLHTSAQGIQRDGCCKGLQDVMPCVLQGTHVFLMCS